MSDDPRALVPTAGTRPVEWLLHVPDVASRLRREPPDRLLVLGCADGTDVLDLALEFPNTTVYGIDTDVEVVQRATEAGRRSRARDRVLFLTGDLLTPRLPGQPDLVVAVGVLTDPRRYAPAGVMALLVGLRRMLAPSGLAVVDTPVPLQPSTATSAGFASLETLGDSAYGCPAYLLRC